MSAHAMNARRAWAPRHEFRFGTREVVIFGAALVLILALTFAFGVLVGRELGISADASARAAAASAPAPEAPPRAEPPDPPRPAERLTFYQTLTAPTPELPATGPPVVEERLVPREATTGPARKTDPRTPSANAPQPAPSAAPARPDAVASAPDPGAAAWTVQVSSFRSRVLAERLRTRLTARGFDAYLVSVTTDGGRVRHRVRVGEFTTRGEAEQVAQEIRVQRHGNAFVTPRSE